MCRPIENGVDPLPSVDRVMIWSEYEAYLLQVKQIGMSACGQTAVLNLLVSLNIKREGEEGECIEWQSENKFLGYIVSRQHAKSLQSKCTGSSLVVCFYQQPD